MIRLIQRRLIIPRGDTGSFSLPALKSGNSDNIAVFTIFDDLTHTKMFQKVISGEGDTLNIAFSHNETVNLKPGKYFWDVKYYQNPLFEDEELIGGNEVDSYYAGFSLPVCEIRETADNYLISPDAPTGTLSPDQLDIITGAINSLNEAIAKTQENVEHYPVVRDEVWYVWDAEQGDYVSTGVRANGIVGNGIASAVLNNDYTLTLNFTDGTSFTSPSIRGETGNGIDDIVLNNDFTLTISYTDGESYVTPSIRGPVGATPQFSIGTVQEGASAAASITGTAENPVLNLTLPNANVPTRVSQLTNDAGYLTTETDPTVPAWAKAAQKPSYTAAEVGAPTVAEMQQAIANVNTMKIHICAQGEYNTETGAPTIQNPDTQTFYLVPGGENDNLFIEWVYVNGAWERFGSADVDLSGYATKDEVPVEYGTGVSSVKTKGVTIGATIYENIASAIGAFAEGLETNATAAFAHAEGISTTASGQSSHAEGNNTVASQNCSHSEGSNTSALGGMSHAEGESTSARGVASHTEGIGTIANGDVVHVEGGYNVADTLISYPAWIANTQYSVGDRVEQSGIIYECKNANMDSTWTFSNWQRIYITSSFVNIVGNGTNVDARSNAYALTWTGDGKYAGDVYVHANADSTGGTKLATIDDVPVQSGTGVNSIVGKPIDLNGTIYPNTASGRESVAIGLFNSASGNSSIAVGSQVDASGPQSAAFGTITSASNHSAFACGQGSHADGKFSFASGLWSTASGEGAHVEGMGSRATASASHAEGEYAQAKGKASHSEGESTLAEGYAEHAQGIYNVASSLLYSEWEADKQYSAGDIVIYDREPYKRKNDGSESDFDYNKWGGVHIRTTLYADIVGNGTADNARSNAYALTWTGDGKYAGNVYVHANADSSGGTKLATVEDIPDVPVTDVQVAGASIVGNDGVANIPIATTTTLGVVKVLSSNGGLVLDGNGALYISAATPKEIKSGTMTTKPIIPFMQDYSVFYGLAKAAGDTTQSASSNSVGTYTDTAKAAIRSMIGATSPNVIAVQDTQPTDADTKIWLPETAETPVQVPTVAEMNAALSGKVGDVQVNGVSVVTSGVANVPIANSTTLGVSMPSNNGIQINSQGKLITKMASSTEIKTGSQGYNVITPLNQHESIFYGLSKAAGVDLANETVTLGTYPETSKTAIKEMLGVQDGLKVVRLI